MMLMGAGALLLTGLIDDLYELSATLRFLLQVGICLLLVKFGNARLEDLGQLFSGNVLQLGWMSIPITVFAAMGVINSFNLIDGMDGLSGTLFLVAAGGMALFAALAGSNALLWLLVLSMASVLGYLSLNARLPWNEKARVFLGDAGTLMLGFLLAWCFIRLGSGPRRVFMPMTAVWLFAVPLLDTSTLIWRRWREGRSAFAADQNHLHHAFLRAGFSVEQTWARIFLLALALAVLGIGFELSRLPEWLSFYTFMLVAFTYYFYLKHSWATQRFLGRHFIHHDFIYENRYA
jgi:UDP-GlcNAc:undecaprenyl-phosphate GlcNAc-1-phosphate transferase